MNLNSNQLDDSMIDKIGEINIRAYTEFLVYINTETGKEEDVLVIIDTPGGILTT